MVYTLTYNAENRLTAISGGGVTASYTYDGDGNRVKADFGAGSVTAYVGAYYEQTTSGASTTITKYYQAGDQRVALRVNGLLRWLAADHLGSTSITADGASGGRIAELRYRPWGETRYSWGATPTQRRFTGQVLDGVAGGLYFYNARYYDPALGRFTQADTIVPQPGNPAALNRYAYSANNPLRYNDPTGHWFETALDIAFLAYDIYDIKTNGLNWTNGLSLVADSVTTLLPVVAGGGLLVRALAHGDDALKAATHADEAVKAVTHVDNIADALKQLDNLPDDEVLYQFSRRPKDGSFQGFPDTLRTKQGETGMSCQIASLCGHDPVQGFKQQMGFDPSPGNWVRETTVGDVKQWGGQVKYDGFPGNPHNLPPGHGTISSIGGKWDKPFDRIWRNARGIVE